MNASIRRTCLIAGVVFALAPATVAWSDETQPPPDAPSFPALSATAPAGSGIMQPCLGDLGGGVRCGRYRVYEDRVARSGRTIDLAFVLADALEPRPGTSDAVAFFFGGPGSSTTENAAGLIPDAADLRRHRDLLLLDFRGVGGSAALDCEVPYPGGVRSRFAEIFPLDHVRACREHLSERARLDLYTSAVNMDDLDELRAWLNYDALNLVGASYGTREIQIYLRRHGEHVRTVVLMGIAPIFKPIYISHARGLQDALDELVAECGRGAACSRTYPDLGATVAALLDRVRDDPPEVEIEGEVVRFGPGALGYALRGLLYRRATEIPALLSAAAQGEWQPLASYYLERTSWVAEAGGVAGMHFSVLCAEDISRVDAEMIARETAGTFLGDHLIGGYARVCEEWPHATLPDSFFEPVKSDVPSLILSGSRDPVTPAKDGDAVAQHLSRHLHLVVPGEGHELGGPCIEGIQDRFIDAGSLDGLDVSCLAAKPPTQFVGPDGL